MAEAVNRISNVGPEGVQAAAQTANRFQADTNSLREQQTAMANMASQQAMQGREINSQQTMQQRELASQQMMQQRQIGANKDLAEMEQLFHTRLAHIETERGIMLEQYHNARLKGMQDAYKGLEGPLAKLQARRMEALNKINALKILGAFRNNPESLQKGLFEAYKNASTADQTITQQLGATAKAQVFSQMSKQIRAGAAGAGMALDPDSIATSLMDGLVNGADPGKLDVNKARTGLGLLVRGLANHDNDSTEAGMVSLGESGLEMRHVHNAIKALSDMSHGSSAGFTSELLKSMGKWDEKTGQPLDPAMAKWAQDVVDKGMGVFNTAHSDYLAAAHTLKKSGRIQSTGEDPEFSAFQTDDVPKIIAAAAKGHIRDPQMQSLLSRLPGDMRRQVMAEFSKWDDSLASEAAKHGISPDEIGEDPYGEAQRMQQEDIPGLLGQESELNLRAGRAGVDVTGDALEGLRSRVGRQYTDMEEQIQRGGFTGSGR